MKAQICNEPRVSFKKFKLEIDVETADELRYLWHIFNVARTPKVLNAFDGSAGIGLPEIQESNPIYDTLNEQAKQMNIRNN